MIHVSFWSKLQNMLGKYARAHPESSFIHIKSSATAILENESLRDLILTQQKNLFGVHTQGRALKTDEFYSLCVTIPAEGPLQASPSVVGAGHASPMLNPHFE